MKKRFFTLPEVMIVVVIFALIATLIVPGMLSRFSANESMRIKREIQAAFANAAIRSQLTGEKTFLSLIEDEESDYLFEITSPERDDEFEEEEELESDKFDGRKLFLGKDTYNIGSDILLEENIDDYTWTFYPDSSASGSSQELTVNGSNFSLKIDRLSGRLILHEERQP